MGAKMVNIRVGAQVVPVPIDENTKAKDIKDALGARDYDLSVNGVRVADNERVSRYLTGREDTVILLPRMEVGLGPRDLSFFRLKFEESLLRSIGFYPEGRRTFRGLIYAGGRVFEAVLRLPSTFPYSRPRIFILDSSLSGLHECIIDHGREIEIHFRDEDWDPRTMTAADMVQQTVHFLNSLLGREPPRRRKRRLWEVIFGF